MSEHLLRAAFAVMARVGAAFADDRPLRGRFPPGDRLAMAVTPKPAATCAAALRPGIGKRRQPHGSGLGTRRWPVERANAWLLEKTPRLDAMANSEFAVYLRRHWPRGPRFNCIENGSPQVAGAGPDGSGEFANGIRCTRTPQLTMNYFTSAI